MASRQQTSFTYLPLTSTDIRRELYVTGWGHDIYASGAPYPHPGHPAEYNFSWATGRVLGDFAVVLITNGVGEYEDRRVGRVTWSAEEVLLLPPGHWHRYRPLFKTGWAEEWCTLNGEYLHRLRAKGFFPRTGQLRQLSEPAACAAALRRLRTGARTNSFLLESRVLEVLAHALEGRETRSHDYSPSYAGEPLVDRALEYIWLNSHRPIGSRDVAMAVGTTRRTLERNFALSHERSPAAEIRWCRAQRAIVMLRESYISVKEVGYATGFGGSKGLVRALHSLWRRTPSDFRANVATLAQIK